MKPERYTEITLNIARILSRIGKTYDPSPMSMIETNSVDAGMHFRLWQSRQADLSISRPVTCTNPMHANDLQHTLDTVPPTPLAHGLMCPVCYQQIPYTAIDTTQMYSDFEEAWRENPTAINHDDSVVKVWVHAMNTKEYSETTPALKPVYSHTLGWRITRHDPPTSLSLRNVIMEYAICAAFAYYRVGGQHGMNCSNLDRFPEQVQRLIDLSAPQDWHDVLLTLASMVDVFQKLCILDGATVVENKEDTRKRFCLFNAEMTDAVSESMIGANKGVPALDMINTADVSRKFKSTAGGSIARSSRNLSDSLDYIKTMIGRSFYTACVATYTNDHTGNYKRVNFDPYSVHERAYLNGNSVTLPLQIEKKFQGMSEITFTGHGARLDIKTDELGMSPEEAIERMAASLHMRGEVLIAALKADTQITQEIAHIRAVDQTYYAGAQISEFSEGYIIKEMTFYPEEDMAESKLTALIALAVIAKESFIGKTEVSDKTISNACENLLIHRIANLPAVKLHKNTSVDYPGSCLQLHFNEVLQSKELMLAAAMVCKVDERLIK